VNFGDGSFEKCACNWEFNPHWKLVTSLFSYGNPIQGGNANHGATFIIFTSAWNY